MKVWITRVNGLSPSATAQYAQAMVSEIGNSIGCYDMAVYHYSCADESWESLSARLDGIIAGIQRGDVVIYQFPSWNNLRFDKALLERILIYGGRLVIFIHDIEAFMIERNVSAIKETVEIFNMAETLIAPSVKMKEYLEQCGVKSKMKYVIQDMWDYVTNMKLDGKRNNIKELHFVESPAEFAFVKNWNSSVALNVYSNDNDENSCINNMGKYGQIDLLVPLSRGGFGLLWYGNQTRKNYMQFNNSFNLVAYLAAGIPVIAPRHISNARLIEQNHLGILVDSLDEAVSIVENITDEEYDGYTEAVQEFSELIRSGYFTKKLLAEAIHTCLRIDDIYVGHSEKIVALDQFCLKGAFQFESYSGNVISWEASGEADGIEVVDSENHSFEIATDNLTHYKVWYPISPSVNLFKLRQYIMSNKGKIVTAQMQIQKIKKTVESPDVSVIIPAYNAEKYLSRAIDSVLAQTLQNVEIIVINDGSSDGTQKVIDWYSSNYGRVIGVYQENLGQAVARNQGIKMAKGRYIAFLDSDDCYRPSMLQCLFESAEKNNVDIAICSVYLVTKAGYSEIINYRSEEDKYISSDDFMAMQICTDISPVVWNKIYRAELVKEHPFYQVPYEDSAWTPIILSYAKSICYIHKPLYEYDRTITNNTSVERQFSKSNEERYQELEAAFKCSVQHGNPEKISYLKENAIIELTSQRMSMKYDRINDLINEIRNM